MTTPYDHLRKAEEWFLLESGWTKLGEDAWREPEADEPRVLEFGHAINSELKRGRERGSSPAPMRYALFRAQAQYLTESGWRHDPRGHLIEEQEADPHPWLAPNDGRNRTRASQKQAVNSQKQMDRIGAKWNIARGRASSPSHAQDLPRDLGERADLLNEAIDTLCLAYGFELTHEDTQGSFLLVPNGETVHGRKASSGFCGAGLHREEKKP